MSTKDKADHIRTVMFDNIQKVVDEGLSGSADMAGALAHAIKTTNIIADVAQENPEAANGLHESLRQLEEMQVIIGQSQAAEAVGDFDAMAAFAQQAADLSGVDFTPDILPEPFDDLSEAMEDGDFDTIRSILATEPNLNQHLGKYDSFPLIWAMRVPDRSVKMLQLLVEAGADVKFATSDGYTALHSVGDYMYRDCATVDDDLALAQYLISQGADLSARTAAGWTPLDRAIFEGAPEEVEALLRAGADPNLRIPEEDIEPFHMGDLPLVNALTNPAKLDLLLAHGADLTARTNTGQTALERIDYELEEQDGDPRFQAYYAELRRSKDILRAALGLG